MFKIQPIQSKDEQLNVAKSCGCEYREGYFAYAMRDNETDDVMGFSQFEIKEDGGYISDIRPRIGIDDFEAMFILGRATMSFIDLCGAHIAYAPHTAGDVTLMLSLGFKEADGVYVADMTDMFNGKCHADK